MRNTVRLGKNIQGKVADSTGVVPQRLKPDSLGSTTYGLKLAAARQAVPFTKGKNHVAGSATTTGSSRNYSCSEGPIGERSHWRGGGDGRRGDHGHGSHHDRARCGRGIARVEARLRQ